MEGAYRNKPLDPGRLKVVARVPGFTGADLENLINAAALLTARGRKKKIGMEEIQEAIERVVAGTEKKSRVISDFEKRIVAFHEAGHALVGHLLPHTDPVHKVSIIPRGRAGGYTLMFPEEDRYYMTRSELLDRVTTLLGGRVAEKLVFNDISTGAQNIWNGQPPLSGNDYGIWHDDAYPITLAENTIKSSGTRPGAGPRLQRRIASNRPGDTADWTNATRKRRKS